MSSNTHPLLKALGGTLGILEALIPSLFFVAIYAITARNNSFPVEAIVVSACASMIFIVIRLVRRESLTQSIAGLIAVIASAILAMMSGRAENNFLLGIITNAVYGVVFLVSIFVRWPLVGVAIGLFTKRGHGWRQDSKPRALLMWLTALWVLMFAVRVAVELPLYFASNVEALGMAKLLLGLPLYAPIVLVTWLFVRGMFIEESTTTK